MRLHQQEQTSENGPGGSIVFFLLVTALTAVLIFGAVDTGTLVVIAVLVSIIVTLWVWQSIRSGKLSLSTDTLQLPLLGLLGIGLVQLLPFGDAQAPSGMLTVPISTTLSLDPYATRFFLMRLYLAIIFFAATLTFVNSISRLKAVVSTLIIFGGALAFYSVLQRVEDPSSIYGLRQPGQALPFGTYINRHHFAALMEMTLGLTLGVTMSSTVVRNRTPFYVTAALAMTVAIILTGSRGGAIGLLVLVVVVFGAVLLTRRDHARTNRMSPVVVIAAGCVLLIIAAGSVVYLGGTDQLLRSAGMSGGAGDLSSGRIEFWRAAVKIFWDHPFIGAGLDAFGTAFTRYDTSNGLFRVEQAHNDYLQMLSDAGILGLAVVAAFIWLFMRKSVRSIRNGVPGYRRGAAMGALAGCSAVMAHSFFDFPLRTPANAFVFLLLAAVAVVTIFESEPRSRHPKER